MTRATACFAFLAVMVNVGCGAGSRHSEDAVGGAVADLEHSDTVDPASSSFKEVKRLGDLVRQAEAEGDRDAAAQYRALLAIQIEIAKGSHTQERLEMQVEAEKNHIGDLSAELARLEEAAADREIEKERRRIRTLVTVAMDESRRKAAADEEYRARFKGEPARSARVQLGRQMLIRGMLLYNAAEVYAAHGFIRSNDRAALLALVDSASKALDAASPDLFAIQTFAEHLSTNAQELIESAWPDVSDTTFESARLFLEATLRSRHIPFESDDFGCRIPVETATGKTPRPKAVSEIASLYGAMPRFLVVVLSTVQTEKTPALALSKSDKLAAVQATALTTLGVEKADVRALGCGTAAPFPVPRLRTPKLQLYLVPLPPETHDTDNDPDRH